MSASNIRQISFFCEPEAFDATLDYWQRVAGVGPFWMIVARPENQAYFGEPTDGLIEAALGYIGNTEVEVIRPLNDAPSPWTEWRRSSLEVPPGGHFHHFMIETEEFDETVANLVEGGSLLSFVAHPPGGGSFAYLDARATFGSWIEVSQRTPTKVAASKTMREVTQNWDGTSPRRSYSDLLAEIEADLNAKTYSQRARGTDRRPRTPAVG